MVWGFSIYSKTRNVTSASRPKPQWWWLDKKCVWHKWPLKLAAIVLIITVFFGYLHEALPMTDSNATEIVTVRFVLDPYRTFQITGTDFKGLDLAELKAALIKHQQTYPGVAYEVFSEVHNTPAAEKEIIDVFNAAGVKLMHYWTPGLVFDRNAPPGKYPGHVDSLCWKSDYRVSQSFREIIERDQRGEYSGWEDFDDLLWSALCHAVDSPQTVIKLPEPVWVYYATRLLEGEVGNGGFAQAAMNIPEWFGLAARGNEILGKPELAAFIRGAGKLAWSEAKCLRKARDGGLEDAFAYFREGNFEKFDRRLDEIGWWCDEERIAYVRANREAFIGLDSVLSGKVHE
jgi:hypothetical protein